MTSQTQENYLKNIYLLLEKTGSMPVTTNELARVMKTKAASVTDMLKKLAYGKLIHYKKYQGVSLTEKGKSNAISIIRKHRLWEYFLVEKLRFQWDEVHEVAEELEHVNSELLIDKLDTFLHYPKFDPHGDPIPDKHGRMTTGKFKSLSSLAVNDHGKVTAVLEQLPSFLQYLDKLHIHMGTPIKVQEKIDFDNSLGIIINKSVAVNVSHQVAKNILIGK